MTLTADQFTEGYKRLLAAFDKPFKTDKALVYERALRHRFEVASWTKAVDRAIAECERFPEVAVLIAIYYRGVREQQAAKASELTECPRCHQHFYYAGFEVEQGLVMPRLRCGCVPYGVGWHTAAAKAWKETDPRFKETSHGNR